METRNKQSCPTCGHAVNRYKMRLMKEMVESLRAVYMWCGEKRRHEFTRKEISHLLKSETQTTNFGQWVYFGGILYKHSKGHWGMNMKRAKAFLHGVSAINTVAWKDPLSKEVELSDPKTIREIKGIAEFLNDEFMFVPEYEASEPVSPGTEGRLFKLSPMMQ